MSNHHKEPKAMSSVSRPSTTFEILREELLEDISLSFENVLNHINNLNRSLESVIAVGHEFASIEALWSTFENVMAKDVVNPPDTNTSQTSPQQHPNTSIDEEAT